MDSGISCITYQVHTTLFMEYTYPCCWDTGNINPCCKQCDSMLLWSTRQHNCDAMHPVMRYWSVSLAMTISLESNPGRWHVIFRTGSLMFPRIECDFQEFSSLTVLFVFQKHSAYIQWNVESDVRKWYYHSWMRNSWILKAQQCPQLTV